MKIIRTILFLIIFFTGSLNLGAQMSISADEDTGCDSLMVNFSLLPENVYDTISEISWSFGDGSSSNEFYPLHNYKETGEFNVSVVINNTFQLNEPGLIAVHPTPDAYFGFSDSLELGSYTYFFRNVDQKNTYYTYTWEWRFEGGSFGPGQKTELHTFSEYGRYMVGLIVSNEFGCSDTVFRKVGVVDVLKVPSVFSPNNDGYNDFLEVRTNGVNKYRFAVYTRSGNLVYKSESPVIFWDGRTFSGNLLRQGTYYYIISQLEGDPRTEKKGFIHLFR